MELLDGVFSSEVALVVLLLLPIEGFLEIGIGSIDTGTRIGEDVALDDDPSFGTSIRLSSLLLLPIARGPGRNLREPAFSTLEVIAARTSISSSTK